MDFSPLAKSSDRELFDQAVDLRRHCAIDPHKYSFHLDQTDIHNHHHYFKDFLFEIKHWTLVVMMSAVETWKTAARAHFTRKMRASVVWSHCGNAG